MIQYSDDLWNHAANVNKTLRLWHGEMCVFLSVYRVGLSPVSTGSYARKVFLTFSSIAI